MSKVRRSHQADGANDAHIGALSAFGNLSSAWQPHSKERDGLAQSAKTLCTRHARDTNKFRSPDHEKRPPISTVHDMSLRN
jgi:hypothetical protein